MGKDIFKCRFCEMPFSVASTLEKHMRKCVVGGKKPGLPPPHWAAAPHMFLGMQVPPTGPLLPPPTKAAS